MPASDVTVRDIYQARQRVAPLAVRTPLICSLPLTEHTDASVHLKLESVQDTVIAALAYRKAVGAGPGLRIEA
jgi:threonine dehydratase